MKAITKAPTAPQLITVLFLFLAMPCVAQTLPETRKAVDQGYAEARLGSMYADGQGVTRDDVEGMKWYRKVHKDLLFLYLNGNGVMPLFAFAVLFFWFPFFLPIPPIGFVLALGHGIYYAFVQATYPGRFKFAGRVLRFVCFVIGLLFWADFMFPLVSLFCVVCFIGQVVLYVFLLSAAYIIMMFAGGEPPKNFNKRYWGGGLRNFLMRYFRWLRTGTVTMERWVVEPRFT